MAGCLLVLCTQVRASAPEQPLALSEVAGLALQEQPLLAAQVAQAAAAREVAVAARQLPDPRWRFGLTSLPVDTFEFDQEPMTQVVIGVSQPLPAREKRHQAGLRAEREAALKELGMQASRNRIVRDARLAWLDAYQAEAAQAWLKRIESELMRQVEWSEVAYKTGQVAQDEVLALRGRLASFRDRIDEQHRRSGRARAELVRWLGEPGRRPLAELPGEANWQPGQGVDDRIDGHPDMAWAQAGVALAEAEAGQARAAYRPDWNLDLAYGLRGGDRPDFVSVMVGVEWPLSPGLRQDRQLAARLSNLEASRHQAEDRRRVLHSELEVALADWRAARDRLARLESEILPLAVRRVDSALTAYRTGQRGFGQVQEARRAELEAGLAGLELRVALARARVVIEYLTEEGP